jgi:hypothetical protein
MPYRNHKRERERERETVPNEILVNMKEQVGEYLKQ